MSAEPRLTIAGDNDLATEMSRHALSAGLADPVYLWRDPDDPMIGTNPVVIVADRDERVTFARMCVEAGVATATLPLPVSADGLTAAIERGSLLQISPLHGIPVLARLRDDCREEWFGRRYGVYAAHRLPRDAGDRVDETLSELIVYLTSLIDSELVSVRATHATPDRNGFTGWFVQARFADATIATLEVSAVLPAGVMPNGDLLVEVTGSNAVLRAEPERQSVRLHGSDGMEGVPWYPEPPDSLLRYALSVLDSEDSTTKQISAMRAIRHMSAAALSDEALLVE